MLKGLAGALRAGVAALALIASAAFPALAQAPTVISGRVVSETGAPIEGASVSIEAAKAGALSKADGSYSLTAPASLRGRNFLTVRRIGFVMKTQTVDLTGGPLKIDITLVAHPLTLTGVTVTALGILSEKTTVGTSQQTLSASDVVGNEAPNLISSMSGKVSGLEINQTRQHGRIVAHRDSRRGLDPRREPAAVHSRRHAGVERRLLDGVERRAAAATTAPRISDLNPDDIASMTVLKGANAAALYGSRATNGAVLITTKSGRGALEGVHWNFSTRLSTETPSVLPKYQNQYGQGFGGAFQYVDGAGGGINDGADESWGPKLDGRLIDQFFGKQQPWVAHPNNVSSYFQTGSTVSNNVNVVAAGKGMGLRFSVTKDNTTGIVPNSSLGKLAGSVSGSATITDKLSVSGSLNYTATNAMNRPENGYTEGNPLMSFTWFGRQVDVSLLKNQYYNSNSVYGFPDGSLFNWNDNYHRNPYWQEYMNLAPDSRDRTIAQASATYQVTDWLSGLVRMGNDTYRFSRDQQFAAGNIDNASAAYNGGFTSSTQRARETNFEGILTAKKSLGRIDLTVNAGGNLRANDSYDGRVLDQQHPGAGHLQPVELRHHADGLELRDALGGELGVWFRGRHLEPLLDRFGHGAQRLVVDAPEDQRVVLLPVGQHVDRPLGHLPVDHQRRRVDVPEVARGCRAGRVPTPVRISCRRRTAGRPASSPACRSTRSATPRPTRRSNRSAPRVPRADSRLRSSTTASYSTRRTT